MDYRGGYFTETRAWGFVKKDAGTEGQELLTKRTSENSVNPVIRDSQSFYLQVCENERTDVCKTVHAAGGRQIKS